MREKKKGRDRSFDPSLFLKFQPDLPLATREGTARTIAATSPTPASAALFTRTGFIDTKRTPVELLAFESANRGLAFFFAAHGDERETA
jgi:hypothetical protein